MSTNRSGLPVLTRLGQSTNRSGLNILVTLGKKQVGGGGGGQGGVHYARPSLPISIKYKQEGVRIWVNIYSLVFVCKLSSNSVSFFLSTKKTLKKS
jgi:hypothetical protein